MSRVLLLAVFALVAGAAPAAAQTHSGAHAPVHPHGPGHVRPDSATHAALHALLHGSWEGTLSAAGGTEHVLKMSVARDSMHAVVLSMHTDRLGGVATNFAVANDTLQWTQNLSGASCKATAVLATAAKGAPVSIKGRMACPDRAMDFSLLKVTE